MKDEFTYEFDGELTEEKIEEIADLIEEIEEADEELMEYEDYVEDMGIETEIEFRD